MGRAGGGGGGHSHSGGGHSSGRSGGGHHVGSSSSGGSRAGAGSSFGGSRAGSGFGGSSSRGPAGGPSSHGPMGGPGSHGPMGGPSSHGPMGGPGSRGPVGGPPPRAPHVAPPHPRHGYAAPPPRRRSSLLSSVIAFIIVLVIVVIAVIAGIAGSGNNGGAYSDYGSGQGITHEREKLDSGVGYRNDCIIDELGWFDNVSKTESRLQTFYDETGVQPYIYLKSYDASLTSDAEKDAWAGEYYDDTFTEENIFLFVYFAEEDTDNDVGYMCYINGNMVSSVMDSEAVEIFWNNIDRYWYSDASTDDALVYAFTDTASTIMADVQSKYDAQKMRTKFWIVLVLVVAVIVILLILFNWWKKKAKRAKEEAAETERILNTPMETLVDQNLKDLENKYK